MNASISGASYEIIATLGPASREAASWRAMLQAGATGFRLNTSHINLDELEQWLERLAPFSAAWSTHLFVTLDLQGSKWRLGQFPPFTLQAGQSVDLVYGDQTTHPNALPVPHTDFFHAAGSSSGEIALNDARSRLQVEKILGPERIRARVNLGGEIQPRKGITLTAGSYRQETLQERDAAILERTRGLTFVRYALSYVRDAAEMERYRVLCGAQAHLTAKLERATAMQEAMQMASSANALWVCRGDLGAELGLPAMAQAVYAARSLPASSRVPVFMAGQVLEHMTVHPTPTRAELCDLYAHLVHGYQGVVLSDETATGNHPAESCRMAALFRTENSS